MSTSPLPLGHPNPSPSTNSSESPAPKPNYLIHTANLPLSAFKHLEHHIDRSNHRHQLSLGDSTGLTKTGVHLCRLPAGATSTTLHWHSHDDEWMYVLEAGEGAVLLVWEPAAGEDASLREATQVVPSEQNIHVGDFLGFKAGVERAHALRAGPERDMVYLLGGSRVPLDITYYPAAGKRMVADSAVGGVSWTVQEQNVKAKQR